MASPESQLRRRGTGHTRNHSDGFGSFVEAKPKDPGLAEPMGEEWQNGQVVQQFSPKSPVALTPKKPSSPGWTDWDDFLSSHSPPKASNPADDAFFLAFESAAKSSQRGPSPPIIDLRPVERKLQPPQDFFSSFESNPQRALGKSSPLELAKSQLQDMHNASTSPLKMDHEEGYFPKEQAREIPGKARTPSPAEGSWTGSLRKTWTSLRGISGDLVSHLPSASDFIVPPEEGEANTGGGVLIASSDERASSLRTSSPSAETQLHGSIAHASSGTPSGPLRARDLFASAGGPRRPPSHANSAPIPGAPGFDANSTRQWNTGHWTLSAASAKRVIPVTLEDRRAETDQVCTSWHAERLQAALPPRLQLGRKWKLLYSLDQHGMSLQTLYDRVAQGLDPRKQRKVSSEAWLRGASSSAKEALGTIAHVGSGLSLQDAGLILAIKDENDSFFGAFVNEQLRPQSHYYGNGECFLWKNVEEEIKTFRWTGKNEYMVLTESGFLSVGGGEGKFGLWIDGQLERGVSARCPAFENEVLCKGGKFECLGLEVWAVGVD